MNAKDEQIETSVQACCPKCGSEDYERQHWAGRYYMPECWWWFCNECEYQTEPE
jgi:hypothetical protein